MPLLADPTIVENKRNARLDYTIWFRILTCYCASLVNGLATEKAFPLRLYIYPHAKTVLPLCFSISLGRLAKEVKNYSLGVILPVAVLTLSLSTYIRVYPVKPNSKHSIFDILKIRIMEILCNMGSTLNKGFLKEKDLILLSMCGIGQSICKNSKGAAISWNILKSHAITCNSCRNAFSRYLRAAGIIISEKTA